jgi:hypothetical protein
MSNKKEQVKKRFELRVVKNVPAENAPLNSREKRGFYHDTKNKVVREIIGFYDTYDEAVLAMHKRHMGKGKLSAHGLMKFELIDHKEEYRIKFRYHYNLDDHRVMQDE